MMVGAVSDGFERGRECEAAQRVVLLGAKRAGEFPSY